MTSYKLLKQDGQARRGQLKTAHGIIETPFFMPAATKGTGKYITTDDYKEIGLPALIANALLLSLRPGADLVMKAGGLHKFINYSGIMFTDCGGFQMSRGIFLNKTKNGLHFRCPFDQHKFIITPRIIMEIELALNSDVAMMLDDMSPYGASFEEAKLAMENTHRWGSESLEIHQELKEKLKSKQLLFGIVQGNFYPTLREESAKYINSLDFDGIAIGGVAIGEPKDKMYEAVESALPFITENKARYVMGVGSPLEIIELVARGIDCFDSVYPTKMARHGHIFTSKGELNIRQSRHIEDFTPLDEKCNCSTCKDYTKAYLYHLIRIDEPVFYRLVSIHNLFFINTLMKECRKAIEESRFEQFRKDIRNVYG
ncbi:tRNA guanosine(34) transglycosylase Tgt [Candidatus Woesearchaeota archaeon]|nr:tRNA guanosine(34) transglycosylase Tgt [Candidatus Woesearchaeota archaeon]